MADEAILPSEHAAGSSSSGMEATTGVTGDTLKLTLPRQSSCDEEDRPTEVILTRNRKRVRPRPSRAPHLDLEIAAAPSRFSRSFPGADATTEEQITAEPEQDFSVMMPGAGELSAAASASAASASTATASVAAASAASDSGSITNEGWELLEARPSRRSRAAAKMLVRAGLRCVCCFRLKGDCLQRAR